jgi:hypothetical protein
MRVRNEESGCHDKIDFVSAIFEISEEGNSSVPNCNRSVDRKIEHLWLRSRQLGWSYNDFVIHFLEVLVVLRHRDSQKRTAVSTRRVAT